jgi:hypothetical protein
MPPRKPLTDEQLRILRAAGDGRLVLAASGRWIIEGEWRPDRRERERLMKRGYVEYGRWPDGREASDRLFPTVLGYRTIGEADA